MGQRHFKDKRFRVRYDVLPSEIRELADKAFELLKADPRHPSLHFKCVRGDLWSARVGTHYRALAVKGRDGFQWFWIGTHGDYDRILG